MREDTTARGVRGGRGVESHAENARGAELVESAEPIRQMVLNVSHWPNSCEMAA